MAPYVQHGVVTLMGSASLSVDEMLGMANNLLYSAKEEGKNGIKHAIVGAWHGFILRFALQDDAAGGPDPRRLIGPTLTFYRPVSTSRSEPQCFHSFTKGVRNPKTQPLKMALNPLPDNSGQNTSITKEGLNEKVSPHRSITDVSRLHRCWSSIR